MKILGQIFLVMFFIILFFVGLLSATLKFQLLNYNFWTTTFQKNNVYQNLATVSKSAFESQITVQGGSKNDITTLTDLITPENAKDVINNNLSNFLNFANGKAPQLNVYLPIDKISKNLIPVSIIGLKSEMPLTDLLAKFNFQDSQNLPLQSISRLGEYSSYIFAGALILFVATIVSLILLVKMGKRFISLGISFLLTGGLTLFITAVIESLNTMLSLDLISKTSLARVVAGAILPSVITEITTVWHTLGLVSLFIGLVLFFIRKPSYNNSK
jgi:hypothetical protein